MRKKTKLGYCTTCNAQVMIFDTDGRPVSVKKNYREAIVELSDGSHGRLAFCVGCLKKGVCAEEAMHNAIDGLREDLKSKGWSDEFKAWYMEPYDQMRIKEVKDIVTTHPVIGILPIKEEERPLIKEFQNLDKGDYRCPKRHTAPPKFVKKEPGEVKNARSI